MRDKILSGAVGTAATVGATVSGLTTFVHEYSHAGVNRVLYNVTEDKVTVNPIVDTLLGQNNGLFGFYTSSCAGLSSVGKVLGNDLSDALYSLAGPLADTSIAIGLYVVGHSLQERHPKISSGLRAAGATYFIGSLMHAWGSAYINYKYGEGEDDISKFSESLHINPYIAPAGIALALPLVALLCHFKNKKRRIQKNKEVNLQKIVEKEHTSLST